MKKPAKVSLGQVAAQAGVSTMAVSMALKNRPGLSAATRQRILKIARKLGYAPDARIGEWMARVRGAKSKDLLPIAWLNTAPERDAWDRYSFQSPYLDGAKARALELGYRVDNIWCREPGMTMQRLSEILYQRGIEGVIVTFPARHLRLRWDHLASVAVSEFLMAPRLHRVAADYLFNLLLAVKSLRRLGHRRVGVCLTRSVDTATNYSILAVARDLCHDTPKAERVPPLFFPAPWMKGGENLDKEASLVAWVKRFRPEVVVCHDNRFCEWLTAAGYRVPADVGVVHLAVDDDVLNWAGIHSHRREIGATAVEWLVALMRNHQFGLPKTPLTIHIRGSWQRGETVLSRRSKS